MTVGRDKTKRDGDDSVVAVMVRSDSGSEKRQKERESRIKM